MAPAFSETYANRKGNKLEARENQLLLLMPRQELPDALAESAEFAPRFLRAPPRLKPHSPAVGVSKVACKALSAKPMECRDE